MTPGGRSDAIRLADVLTAIELISSYTSEGRDQFLRSSMQQDAVIRQLEIMGETAGHVSEPIRKRHPDVPWKQMRGFASFSKHEYWKVDPARVWNVVEVCLSLRTRIAAIRAM